MNLEDIPQLILVAQSRDCAAVSRLLAAYRNYLRVLAQIWLPPNLPAKLDPSDLVQEALLRAHQGFEQFQGKSEAELTAWLRRILSRCVVDVVRQYQAAARDVARERRLENDHDESAHALDRLFGAAGSSPSHQAARRELGVVLANTLAEMSEDLRQVITLRSLQELAWKDVATTMDRSVSTVRDLWVHALCDLRKRLEKFL
jgi:RNA polymerase sigma-70 factor (ECF subfamily)